MNVVQISAGERRCPVCGYDLRGAITSRCSECGMAVGRRVPAGIPWMHRGALGSGRAYLRTAAMVLRRPGKIAAAAARPMSRRAAADFYRRSVAFTIFIGMVLATLGLAASEQRRFAGRDWELLAITLGALWATVEVSGRGWRWLVAGGSDRPREQVRRRCAATYLSGLAPLVTLLVGLAAASWWWPGIVLLPMVAQDALEVAGDFLLAAAYGALVVPSVVIMAAWGAGPLRWVLAVVLLPLFLWWLWTFLGILVLWSAGVTG